MKLTVSAMLVIVGVIHLLPVSGLLGRGQLEKLYGLPISDPNLLIVMQHRAVMFGLLGLFLIYAAYRIDLQRLALIAGFISAGAFVWLAWSIGGYNALIGRVVVADLVALACLVIGAVGHGFATARHN